MEIALHSNKIPTMLTVNLHFNVFFPWITNSRLFYFIFCFLLSCEFNQFRWHHLSSVYSAECNVTNTNEEYAFQWSAENCCFELIDMPRREKPQNPSVDSLSVFNFVKLIFNISIPVLQFYGSHCELFLSERRERTMTPLWAISHCAS